MAGFGRGYRPIERPDRGLPQMAELVDILNYKRISVRRLARMVNIDHSNISQWLRGHVNPTLANVDALFNAVGYDLVAQSRERRSGRPPKIKRAYFKWTRPRVRVLADGIKAGCGAAKLASELGITERTVRDKAFNTGLQFRKTPKERAAALAERLATEQREVDAVGFAMGSQVSADEKSKSRYTPDKHTRRRAGAI